MVALEGENYAKIYYGSNKSEIQRYKTKGKC